MKCAYAVLLLSIAAAVPAARAASFDCAKAQRPVEKAICGNASLNQADEQMGRVYRDALGKLSRVSVGLLRADQVEWLAWAQQLCRADMAKTSLAAMAKCLQPLYDERTKQLRTTVVRRDGLTLLTRTQYLAAPEEASESMGSPEYPGFGTLQATWQTVDSADPKWVAWNTAIEAQAFAMTGDSENPGKVPPTKAPWTASLAEGQDTTITSQLKSLEHGRVTATLNLGTMGHGAAHPSENFKTVTWMLDAGRLLRAEDVFAPGGRWRRRVAEICWKSLSTGEQKAYIYPEVSSPAAKSLQDVIADTDNWTLEPDGLHISYPEYSVAPRVSPVEDTVIPWAALKPVLATGFVAP